MRISVIIPAWNAAPTLTRALESVVAQTLPVEVVVVDDGSTDATFEVFEAARRRAGASHWRYVRQQNAGPSAARNHAIRIARGDWVALLDADDYWYPRKLERQIAFLRSHPDAAVACGGVDTEDERGERRRLLPAVNGYFGWRELLVENVVFSPTPLARREALLAAGGFDETRRLAEDWDLWLRMAERFRMAAQPLALACYSDGPGGLHRTATMLAASREVLEAAASRRGLPPRKIRRGMAGLHLAEACARAADPGGSRPAGVGRLVFKALRHDPARWGAALRLSTWMWLRSLRPRGA